MLNFASAYYKPSRPMSTEPEIYSFDQSYEASLKYFDGDELAARVWVSKYALKDSEGNIYELTPDDMHRRLARELERIENKYPNPMDAETIFGLLRDFRYVIPAGSPMAGIGNSRQAGSLSNCFVIGIDGKPDSYGGIMRIDQEQVQLTPRRSRARSVPSSSQRFCGEEFRAHIHGPGAFHGALLQFHT